MYIILEILSKLKIKNDDVTVKTIVCAGKKAKVCSGKKKTLPQCMLVSYLPVCVSAQQLSK